MYTPIDSRIFSELLQKAGYEPAKIKFLVDGFRNGFDLKYQGPCQIQHYSPNLRFVVGDETEMWNKVMKEVELKRVAGPYPAPPLQNLIQSPLGLVPKDKGLKTRLIFHLSYPRGMGTSVNSCTPKEDCTVKYLTFDDVVLLCMKAGPGCKAAKSDLTSAFRHLGVLPKDWMILVMKAKHPVTKQVMYFVDKCLPFGHAMSCALFQKVSDAISYLVKFRTKRPNVNYLDDSFFTAIVRALCNNQVTTFLEVCRQICFPVSLDKTYWATTKIIFVG